MPVAKTERAGTYPKGAECQSGMAVVCASAILARWPELVLAAV